MSAASGALRLAWLECSPDPSRSIGVILADVTAQGYGVLGIEGFDVDPTIRPRLDLIVDNTAGHPFRDPAIEGQTWGDEVWIDVTLARKTG